MAGFMRGIGEGNTRRGEDHHINGNVSNSIHVNEIAPMRDERVVLRWSEESSFQQHLPVSSDVGLPIEILREVVVIPQSVCPLRVRKC